MKKLLLASVLFGSFYAMPSQAAVVDFEDKSAFSCGFDPVQSSGAMSWTTTFASCFYSPAQPADFPTAPPSTVMSNGYSDTTFSLTAGGVFSISGFDLGFGPFSHAGQLSDTTFVTGNLFGGGTLTTTLVVNQTFSNYVLNWGNLTSITFSALQSTSEYLAFDNINYATAAVPEPATWAMMIGGFALAGGAMRRRKAAVSYA